MSQSFFVQHLQDPVTDMWGANQPFEKLEPGWQNPTVIQPFTKLKI